MRGWRGTAYHHHGFLCLIRPLKGAVSLGFYRGDRLANQDHLLRGFARHIRFVRIAHPADPRLTRVAELIAAAGRLNEAEQDRARRRSFVVSRALGPGARRLIIPGRQP